MMKELAPKRKLISHAGAAIGGIALGYLSQRRRLDRMRQENQAARFNTLRVKGEARQAGYDEVTGLPRRWAIVEAYQGLAKAWRVRNHTRSGEQVADPKASRHSVLMIDLDHFKAYNDRYGHNAGDELLYMVAGVMKDRLRDRDVVARWGGEEFSAILPRATEEDAVAVAEELRESLEATGKINVSIGVAEIDFDGSLDSNIATADQALYAAKENGRNQVVAFSSLTPVAS